jgi:hypothetical protein
MFPLPSVVGLALCEKIMVEEGTRSVSLIGCFVKISATTFPSPPKRFDVHAALTGGLGEGTIDLLVTQLETGQAIYSGRRPVGFPDRLTTVWMNLRLKGLSFPAPARYQFTLLLDGEWLTQTVLDVIHREKNP